MTGVFSMPVNMMTGILGKLQIANGIYSWQFHYQMMFQDQNTQNVDLLVMESEHNHFRFLLVPELLDGIDAGRSYVPHTV